MTNTLLAIIIYAAIGGLLVGAFSNDRHRKCGEHITTIEFAAIAALWPAFMTASLFVDTGDKLVPCPAKIEDKP